MKKRQQLKYGYCRCLWLSVLLSSYDRLDVSTHLVPYMGRIRGVRSTVDVIPDADDINSRTSAFSTLLNEHQRIHVQSEARKVSVAFTSTGGDTSANPHTPINDG